MLRIISKTCCILFFSFSFSVFAEKTDTEVNSVNKFMQSFIQAYEKGELNSLIQSYDINAVVIGTGKDEILQGRKQIKESFQRDLNQHTSATIKMTPIAVDVEKNFAFAAYNLLVNVQLPNKKFFQSPLRLTVTLIKQNNSWLIIQSHLSSPLAGQEDGQAFPTS